MPHGDFGDARYAPCGCGHCVLTRKFLAFRDDLPPDRPLEIRNRKEAAAYLRWHAAQLVQLIDEAGEE